MKACKIWSGYRTTAGYGARFTGGRSARKIVYAHREAWQAVHGPIAPGVNIHHRCQERACYEESHLEAVTPKQHRLRHRGSICRRGHPRTEANTYRRRDGTITCRICKRAQERVYYHEKG